MSNKTRNGNSDQPQQSNRVQMTIQINEKLNESCLFVYPKAETQQKEKTSQDRNEKMDLENKSQIDDENLEQWENELDKQFQSEKMLELNECEFNQRQSDKQLIKDILELSNKWEITPKEQYSHVNLFNVPVSSISIEETASTIPPIFKKQSSKIEKVEKIEEKVNTTKSVADIRSYCVQKFTQLQEPERCNCLLF